MTDRPTYAIDEDAITYGGRIIALIPAVAQVDADSMAAIRRLVAAANCEEQARA